MDWIQFPFEVDARVHRGAGAPILRLRWVYTDQPFLPVGTQAVILNRIWDEDQVTDLAVGQLPVKESRFDQDARLKLPALAFTGHMCHPEWLSVGEPWPIPSDLPPTVYLDGWIPECCAMCCVFIGCSLDPVNDQPASQHLQYATDAKDATGATPALISQVGDALGGTGPDVRGASVSYHPLGRDGAAGYSLTPTADAAGVMVQAKESFTVDDDNHSERTLDADGHTWDSTVAGDATQMTLRVVGGVGKLCGTNLQICAEVMPLVQQWDTGFAVAAGTNQATAQPVTARFFVSSNTVNGRGCVLPTISSGVGEVRVFANVGDTLPFVALNLYPAVGEQIQGLAANAPLVIPKQRGVILFGIKGAITRWCYLMFTTGP